MVRLIRSTKFLDRQCVRRSPKVSGGMPKTNYESNACLLVEIRPPRARTKIGAQVPFDNIRYSKRVPFS